MKSQLPWSSQESLDLDKMRLGPKILDESWKVNDIGESLSGTGNVFVAAEIFLLCSLTLCCLSILRSYSWVGGRHRVESGFHFFGILVPFCLSAHEVWPGAGGSVMDLRSLLTKVFWTPAPEGKGETLPWTGQRHAALRLSEPRHRSGSSKIRAWGGRLPQSYRQEGDLSLF